MKELYSRQAYKGDAVIAMSQFVQLVVQLACEAAKSLMSICFQIKETNEPKQSSEEYAERHAVRSVRCTVR
jgi:hypothetical protein